MEGHAKNRPRRARIQKSLYEISFFLELAVAAFVIVLILWFLARLVFQFFQDPAGAAFAHFLELSLDIVIGIEFLKMLCRHNMDSVVEVMLFTLARHMIVTETSMLENLLCVAGAALLFVVRKFLFVPQIDNSMDAAPGNTEPLEEPPEQPPEQLSEQPLGQPPEQEGSSRTRTGGAA